MCPFICKILADVNIVSLITAGVLNEGRNPAVTRKYELSGVRTTWEAGLLETEPPGAGLFGWGA